MGQVAIEDDPQQEEQKSVESATNSIFRLPQSH